MDNFNQFLIVNPFIASVLLFILGLCVGSFLNVVIHRLPIMLNQQWRCLSKNYLDIALTSDDLKVYNLVLPPSTCPKCDVVLKPWHNVPLISYLYLRGKCYHCKAPIRWRYPLVELTTALLSLLVLLTLGFTVQTLFGLLFTWTLIALTFIDLDTQLLPDNITLPLLWTGLLVNTHSVFTPLDTAVYSAVGGYLFLWGFARIFYWSTGKEGMGEGDFKLFAAFGAWFGWLLLPLILIIASLVGAIVGVFFIKITHQHKDTPIPFGPFLCMAALLAMLWGHDLVQWYLAFYIVPM